MATRVKEQEKTQTKASNFLEEEEEEKVEVEVEIKSEDANANQVKEEEKPKKEIPTVNKLVGKVAVDGGKVVTKDQKQNFKFGDVNMTQGSNDGKNVNTVVGAGAIGKGAEFTVEGGETIMEYGNISL